MQISGLSCSNPSGSKGKKKKKLNRPDVTKDTNISHSLYQETYSADSGLDVVIGGVSRSLCLQLLPEQQHLREKKEQQLN